LPYEVGYGHLSKTTSEDTARKARYTFLEQIRSKYKADAIVTAHHQDDLIETAVLNILRGTGHRGLKSISANKGVLRPLLGYSKNTILNYAKVNKLRWREDVTNQEEIYLRNYLRNKVLAGLTPEEKKNLISNIDKIAKTSSILENKIARISHNIYRNEIVIRDKFSALPVSLGNELIAYWLREFRITDFDKHTINRVNIALRTSKAGTIHPVKKGLNLEIDQKNAHFAHTL
jgi:tRNA(Ile)-lysidine synthase TilS/MesJ